MENYLALSIGLIGSLHCLGMCGPLMLLFSFGNKTKKGILYSLVYHLSRVFTYVVLGALVGGLMNGIQWFGLTQKLSILMGILMFGFGMISLLKLRIFQNVAPKFSFVNNLYSKTIKGQSGVLKFVIAGFLNGLLPCGLVYVTLSGATLSNTWQQGAVYMLFFGLGTIPALLGVNIFSVWIKNKLSRFRTQYLLPSVFLVTGLLLLLRGLNVGIPYLSPKIEQSKVSCCHAK